MMWSRNEIGVMGCIFHLSVDRISSSILCMVLASNTYFVSSTYRNREMRMGRPRKN